MSREPNETQAPAFGRFSAVKRTPVRLSPEALIRTGQLSPERSLPLVIQPNVDDFNLAVWAESNRQFIEKQPPSVRLGVVAFGGTGLITERPTTDKAAVLAAVNRLNPQGETSLGGGLLGALSAIAGRPITKVAESEAGSDEESDIGYYGGTSIVLLTDGENTTGPEPRDVAELTSAAGVRIEPIGLGTPGTSRAGRTPA